MNGDDMVSEGGPIFAGPDDVFVPPLEFEVDWSDNPHVGILIVKREGKIIYHRPLSKEESDAAIKDTLNSYSFMKEIEGNS